MLAGAPAAPAAPAFLALPLVLAPREDPAASPPFSESRLSSSEEDDSGETAVMIRSWTEENRTDFRVLER